MWGTEPTSTWPLRRTVGGGVDMGGSRSRPASTWVIGLCLALSALVHGCRSLAPAPLPSAEAALHPASRRLAQAWPEFSAERAFADLEYMAQIRRRSSRARAVRLVRSHLRLQLEEMGARVDDRPLQLAVGGAQAVSLVGVLPGESPDVLLLAAPYDPPRAPDLETGAAVETDAGSGAALLLEIGRALARSARPYTVWLAFIDGDGEGTPGDGSAEPGAAAAGRFPGSDALAARLAERGEISRVRLAVFFDRVARPKVSIARDIFSQREYREVFWKSARDLGLDDTFAPGAGLRSPPAGHRAFLARRLRPVVAIVDERYAGVERVAAVRPGEPDAWERGSRESLAKVGAVVLEALDRITRRLARIDHFSRSPLGDLAATQPASGAAPIRGAVRPEGERESPAAR